MTKRGWWIITSHQGTIHFDIPSSIKGWKTRFFYLSRKINWVWSDPDKSPNQDCEAEPADEEVYEQLSSKIPKRKNYYQNRTVWYRNQSDVSLRWELLCSFSVRLLITNRYFLFDCHAYMKFWMEDIKNLAKKGALVGNQPVHLLSCHCWRAPPCLVQMKYLPLPVWRWWRSLLHHHLNRLQHSQCPQLGHRAHLICHPAPHSRYKSAKFPSIGQAIIFHRGLPRRWWYSRVKGKSASRCLSLSWQKIDRGLAHPYPSSSRPKEMEVSIYQQDLFGLRPPAT